MRQKNGSAPKMYKRQIGARAADGIASHGSLDAYIGDLHACSKAFDHFTRYPFLLIALGCPRGHG